MNYQCEEKKNESQIRENQNKQSEVQTERVLEEVQSTCQGEYSSHRSHPMSVLSCIFLLSILEKSSEKNSIATNWLFKREHVIFIEWTCALTQILFLIIQADEYFMDRTWMVT